MKSYFGILLIAFCMVNPHTASAMVDTHAACGNESGFQALNEHFASTLNTAKFYLNDVTVQFMMSNLNKLQSLAVDCDDVIKSSSDYLTNIDKALSRLAGDMIVQSVPAPAPPSQDVAVDNEK